MLLTITNRLIDLLAASDDSERTVVAGRRRRSDETAGRERAEAPQRRESSSSSGGGWSGGGSNRGGSSSSGGSRRDDDSSNSGGKAPGWLILIALIVVIAIGGMGLFNTGNSTDEGKTSAYPTSSYAPVATEEAVATALPRPTRAPQTSSSGKSQKWLVMLYQDADDKVLEQDIFTDLNEAERVGSSDQLSIVAQVDRYKGGFKGDGNWTSAKRYYVTQDDDLEKIASQEVADLGEVNMSEPQTLVDFATWAMRTYPADKYVLILSDHGMGWPGGFTDAAAAGSTNANRSVPLEESMGNMLYLNDLDQVLGNILTQSGVDKFELVGLDACLMGHLEVLDALAPHARYAVLSQETEPSLGWAYSSFLGALAQNSGMDGAELAKTIVSSYIQDDQLIVDDQARAQWLRRSGSDAESAEATAQEMSRDVTLSAVDLSAVPELVKRVDDLAVQMKELPQKSITRVRSRAQSYTSVFGDDVPPSYIDLGSFAALLKKTKGLESLGSSASAVQTAIKQAVIAEKHGSDKPGATGISIYFPNSALYDTPEAGAKSYTAIANRFAEHSLWDDYLAFHYSGRDFDASTQGAAVPSSGAKTRAPGAGDLKLSKVTASSKVAAPGSPVTLSAKLNADSLGYVYLFTGYYDKRANSIFVADEDYLESADTQVVDDVYYPDWGEGDFTLQFSWEPLMYAITDGKQSVQVALMPQSYGASYHDTVYSVDGTYRFADGSAPRRARLFFRDGQLRKVYAIDGAGDTGAMAQITPEKGDTFTVLETWIDLDTSGKPAKTSTQDGGTLTFGDQVFKWKELDAAAGDYQVGFIAQDLDGNTQASYAQVTVK
jgi:clostripain